MKGKKIISCLLVIVMMFSLFPTTIIAEGSSDNMPTFTLTMDESTADDGYYKLVAHVTAPNGIKSLETWITYDNTKIVPWDIYNSKEVSDVTEKDSDQTPYAYYCGLANLSVTKLNRTTYYSQLFGALDETGTNKTMWYCLQFLESGYLTSAVDTDYMEFYFTLADGVKLDDLNNETFSIYCSNSGSSVSMQDASLTVYKYYNGSTPTSAVVGTYTDIPEANVSLTYPHSTEVDQSKLLATWEHDDITEYITSIAELQTAFQTGGTITMKQNVDLTDNSVDISNPQAGEIYYLFYPLMIPEGVEVTLNLNGKEISGKGSTYQNIYGWGEKAGHLLENNGTLTVNGPGTLNSTSASNNDGTATVYNTGTLTMNNVTVNMGTLVGSMRYGWSAVYNEGTGTIKELNNCVLSSVNTYTLWNRGRIDKITGTSTATSSITASSSSGIAIRNFFTASGSSTAGSIGVIENTTLGAVELRGSAWGDGDTWDNHTWTIEKIQNCVINSNTGAGLSLNKQSTIGSVTDSEITGATNGIYIDASSSDYHGGIGTLNATVTATNGSAFYIEGAAGSNVILDITGGKYKPSAGNVVYNSEKVKDGTIFTGNFTDETMGFIGPDADGYYTFDTLPTYTVTFMNGDTQVNSQTVKYGNTATAPEAPTKEGYTFKGWSTTENGEATVSDGASIAVSGDVTYYAVFDINSYTVKFVNGTSEETRTANYGETITAPTATSESAGKRFLGWNTNSNATVADVQDNGTITVTGNATYYAVFEDILYTVTFMNGSEKAGEKTGYLNDQVQYSGETPTKEGYTFLGWGTSETATVADVQENGTIAINGDATYYAVFKINGYTVTFMNGNETFTTQRVEHGNFAAEPANEPTKDANGNTTYTFKHWSAEVNGTAFDFLNSSIKGDTILYAVYDAETKVETKPDTSGNAKVENVTVEENAPITITATSENSSKTDATVSIGSDVVDSMKEKDTPKLTIETNVADVTFDQKALSEITGNSNAQKSGVKLETKETSKEELATSDKTQKIANAIQSKEAKIIDLNLTDGNGNEVKFTGGTAEIKMPFKIAEEKIKDFAMFYIDEYGKKEKLKTYKFDGEYVTFTAEHFSYYVADNSTSYTLTAALDGGITDFNPGDTITVNIQATANKAATIGSFEFTLDYDKDLLTLTGIDKALEGTLQTNTKNGKAAYVVKDENGVDISTDDPTIIATATFTVNTGITDGTATINLTDPEMTTYGYTGDSDLVPEVNDVTVNLHNIKVTLNADQNSIINHGNSLTLYAKYNEAGLYSDEARTTGVGSVEVQASPGYRLADNNWTDGTNQFASFSEIAKQTFTESATYTLKTVQQFTVTFESGEHGSLTADKDAQTLDKDSTITNWPTTSADTGYSFDAWYVGTTKINTETYEVTGDVTLTAKFTANTYEYITSTDHVTLSDVTGLTDGKATYGQDITFTAKAADGYVLCTVTYQIGDSTDVAPITLKAENGVYTIPGDQILGNVTISADATAYYTVTFKAGEGTLLNGETGDVTAYALTGTSTLYGSYEALVAGGTSSFTVPTVTLSDDEHRLPKADETAWTDGENGTYTASAVENLTVSKTLVLTAQAIKTYTVTFAADSNGAIAEGTTSTTVDTGTAKSDVKMPDTTPNPGYKFEKWTWSADGDTITGNITATANFTDESYVVSTVSSNSVTITSNDTTVNDKGETVATHGKDVTFTVNIASSGVKVTKVTYQIGSGAEQTALDDANGIASGETFTIEGKDITGAISVNVVSNATYQITFTAGEHGTVNGTSSVTKTFDKDYVIQESDLPTVSGNTGYEVDTWSPESPVGQTVTTDTEYTVSFKPGTYDVNLPEGVTADGVSNATYLENLTFTPTASEKIITNVTAKIGETAIKVTKNDNGSYTIDGEDITGAITIEVTSIVGTIENIMGSKYKALEDDTKIVIIKTKQLETGKYTLTGVGDLFYSSKYGGYVTIVNAPKDTNWTNAEVASKLTKSEGTAPEISYNGDVDNSGRVRASDAGAINTILHGGTLEYTPDTKMRLELDVNGDGVADTEDIVWVLEEVVGLHGNTTTSTDTDSNEAP